VRNYPRLSFLKKVGFRAWLAILLGLLFFGALFWAKGRDPFERVRFTVKTLDHGKAKGVAVLPKTATWPLPVVIYLRGSDGSVAGSGNELRWMAEMGLAAVGMEFNETNGAAFEAQFTALLNYVQQQRWSDTNAVAWVGSSLGANRTLAYALKHPEMRPRFLLAASGGWVGEFEMSEARGQAADIGSRMTEGRGLPSVLLLQGEPDAGVPIAQARGVAALLATNGFQVEIKTFRGSAQNFDADRLVLMRVIAEACLAKLRGADALRDYESILVWQRRAKPLWLFWLPAGVWVLGWSHIKRFRHPAGNHPLSVRWGEGSGSILPSEGLDSERAGRNANAPRLARWEIGLRWLAGILVLAALGLTVLHLVTPRLGISPRTLGIARRHLVQARVIPDFVCLGTNSAWAGKRLRALLEQVELANYNRRLVNWKLDDEVYREFVLSAQIDASLDGEMNWRRPLWESFYPRIRKEDNLDAAAEIIVRHLRQLVTIARGLDTPASIAEIWRRQVTNEHGFAVIYVAALRSAGVPARLDATGDAEFWTGAEWKTAPRPLVVSLR